MPSIISRLNCFSKKSKTTTKLSSNEWGGNDHDEVHTPLSFATGSSSSTSPRQKVGESSETSKGSKLSGISSPHNSHNNDDESIPTVDPDYNHVQLGNLTASVAGGTIGSQDQSLGNFSQANASAFGSMAPSAFGFGASSIPGDYNNYPPSLQAQEEEMLEIYAPMGKLGLVIDTPATATTPVVHAIKDTCPIRREIYVGDKLVAVDDVDVRDMQAVEVSRLISKKSGQEQRKLTIIRTARGRDGMY